MRRVCRELGPGDLHAGRRRRRPNPAAAMLCRLAHERSVDAKARGVVAQRRDLDRCALAPQRTACSSYSTSRSASGLKIGLSVALKGVVEIAIIQRTNVEEV